MEGRKIVYHGSYSCSVVCVVWSIVGSAVVRTEGQSVFPVYMYVAIVLISV